MIMQKSQRARFLYLLPILFLILNSLYFAEVTREIAKVLLEEKYQEVVTAVDMLAMAVEAVHEPYWADYGQSTIRSVEFLDRQHQVYAEAFQVDGVRVTSITKRYYETSPFEPFKCPEFVSLIQQKDSGGLVVGYAPENQDYRELHLYFRWLPVCYDPLERYLVVAGVSRHSVTVAIGDWVTLGQMVSMVVTFVFNVTLVLLLARLGHIYSMRNGDPWRSRRSDEYAARH